MPSLPNGLVLRFSSGTGADSWVGLQAGGTVESVRPDGAVSSISVRCGVPAGEERQDDDPCGLEEHEGALE